MIIELSLSKIKFKRNKSKFQDKINSFFTIKKTRYAKSILLRSTFETVINSTINEAVNFNQAPTEVKLLSAKKIVKLR